MGLFSNYKQSDELNEGIVQQVYRPGEEWIVRVNDVYWHALSPNGSNFLPGDRIQVIGQKNIKLLISPM